MFNKTLISLLAFLIILSSCARAPKEISLKDTQERVDQDLLKIEKIKKFQNYQKTKLRIIPKNYRLIKLQEIKKEMIENKLFL